MRKLPPLNAVRAFESAARHVSFTKAANELCVTHGAISKQVAVLESWLGVALFHRSQSQITLSDAGHTLLAAVTPALDRISVTAQQLLEHSQTVTLRVNAPPTFTMRWMIPRLSSFQRRNPGAEIKLTTGTGPVNLDDGQCDVVIRGAQQPLAGMVAVPFMTEMIVPICHPDLLDRGCLQKPQDLQQHTLIGYDTEPLSWSSWLAFAEQPDLRSAHVLQFEQMYFALQAAAEGLGVVLVPLFLVADDVITGKLCAPFGVELARKRQYFANSAHNAPAQSLIEPFTDWLLKEGQDTERSIALLAQGLRKGQTIPSLSQGTER